MVEIDEMRLKSNKTEFYVRRKVNHTEHFEGIKLEEFKI